MNSTRAWMQKVGPWGYLGRMARRQFVKRVLRRDLTLRLDNGRDVLLPRTSGFSSVAWVTKGRVDDGYEELLRWFAPAETVFFDVGAHFGFYSVFMADIHPMVVAFEPDVRTLPALRRNLASIGGAVCVEAAVSDRVGSLRFVADESSPQSRVLAEGSGTELDVTVEVPVTTLDATWESLSRPKIGSMKIDTECHESAVLQGGQKMIGECRPQMLIEATATSLAPHTAWLDQLGYCAVLLGERHRDRIQSVRVIALSKLADAFVEGMILLLPPEAREQSAWNKLQAAEIRFSETRRVEPVQP